MSKAILENYPPAVDVIVMQVGFGYDIGITKNFEYQGMSFAPGNWEKRSYFKETLIC